MGTIDTVNGSLGGYSMTKLKKWPSIVQTPYGVKAALFNCSDSQAVLVRCAPLGTATAFTVEVFFRPDSLVLSGTNNEQRFVHIRNPKDDNRRVLMETRTFANMTWILDTYIKSELSNKTINDSSITFADGGWHHVALVYKDTTMYQYVDQVELHDSTVTYQQIDTAGSISIGARQDPRSWFKGAILMVKITKRALSPSEFTIPTVQSVARDLSHPVKFALEQNYPNPCNPSTVIGYQLSVGSRVTLKVYDILGREVATLVDEKKNEGTYEVPFDVSRISSGIYFYRLTTPGKVFSRKMIVLK
jgi:hypothetical protein